MSDPAPRPPRDDDRHRDELDEAAEIVASMSDATLLRSVAAIIVGFVVLTLGSVAAGRALVAATGLDAGAAPDTAYVALSLGSRFLMAVLAGYLTARAAPRRPLAHGLVLAGIVAFLALVALWGLRAAGVVQDPPWYPGAMVFVGPGGVLAGASIRARALAAAVVVLLATGAVSCAPPPGDATPETVDAPETPVDTAMTLRGERNFVSGYPALAGDDIRVVVEIPAGTNAKWETTKTGETIEWEIEDGRPRVVRYLAYPANYGMVPRTILPEAIGGDGDPLDVLLLGPALPRGTVVTARPVGVLDLLDTGEDDDKILAVPLTGLFSEVRDVDALRSGYPGVLEIVERWFTSYKGPAVMESGGVRDAAAARAVIGRAAEAYEAFERCGSLDDGQGHGPDPFSEEWWSACRRRLEAAGSGDAGS